MSLVSLSIPIPRVQLPGEFVCGEGGLVALRGLQGSRVAVIAGDSVLDNPAKYDAVCNSVKCHSLKVIRRSWSGEPGFGEFTAAMTEIEQFQPDVIVAVGGGGIIDAARFIWLLYEHPGVSLEQVRRPFNVPALRGKCRFVAIPSTVGSGAEASSSAVLYDADSGQKVPIVTHDFLPDLVILDPLLLQDIPPALLLSTLCDALSHTVEGYVSAIDNPMVDSYAEKALQLIARNWQGAVAGEVEALLQLQIAASYAGIVQNHCVVGITHAIAHQMTRFGISHSDANGMLLQAGIRFNAANADTAQKLQRLALNAGIGQGLEDVLALVESINGQRAALVDHGAEINALQQSLKDDAVIDAAVGDNAARFNPVEVTADAVRSVIGAAL